MSYNLNSNLGLKRFISEKNSLFFYKQNYFGFLVNFQFFSQIMSFVIIKFIFLKQISFENLFLQFNTNTSFFNLKDIYNKGYNWFLFNQFENFSLILFTISKWILYIYTLVLYQIENILNASIVIYKHLISLTNMYSKYDNIIKRLAKNYIQKIGRAHV